MALKAQTSAHTPQAVQRSSSTVGHEDADRLAALDLGLQEEMAVRLLDVGVQEPDCHAAAGEQRREVGRERRLAGAALAAGDGDAHRSQTSASASAPYDAVAHAQAATGAELASITAVSSRVMRISRARIDARAAGDAGLGLGDDSHGARSGNDGRRGPTAPFAPGAGAMRAAVTPS